MNIPQRFGLSPREVQVASAIVAGYSNKEIAEYLKLSEHAIKNYVFRLFDKLVVSTRAELALLSSEWADGPEDGDAAGIAVKKPRSPNLNRGSAAANLDEQLG